MERFVELYRVSLVSFIATNINLQDIVCRFARVAHNDGKLGLDRWKGQGVMLTLDSCNKLHGVDNIDP